MRYSDYLDGANDNSPTRKRRYPQPIGNQSGALGNALSGGTAKTGPITKSPRTGGSALAGAIGKIQGTGTISKSPRGSVEGDRRAKEDIMKKEAIRRRLSALQKR